MAIQQMLLGAGGKKDPLYVDDVFSSYVYEGSGSSKTITTGLNLSGEGGMTWIKSRNHTYGNKLADTERGNTKVIQSDSANVEATETQQITSWSSTGFVLGTNGGTNSSDYNFASWSFRKQKGFFDVVTYTGNGTAGRTVAHSLDSVPGMILVKCTSEYNNWAVYHKELGATKILHLDTNAGESTGTLYWNDTAPTSSVFSVGTSGTTNKNGETYVAYLFAHDAQLFGEGENASVIKCGSYTGNGSSTGPTINLGWEPQYLLIKNSETTTNWRIVDNMRGIVTGGNEAFLTPDLNEAEFEFSKIDLTSTGFKITASNGDVNENNDKIIYVAIRRPDGYVGKPPSAGTDVFNIIAGGSGSTGGDGGCFTSNFPVDFGTIRTTGSHPWQTGARLMGVNYFPGLNQNNATTTANNFSWDSNIGYVNGNFGGYYSWVWRRHAGFDCIAYEGNGTAGKQVNHSLSKTPEMIWIKNRGEAANWVVYHKDLNGGTNPEQYYLRLNTDDAEIDLTDLGLSSTLLFNDTAPTSTVVTLGDSGNLNKNGFDHLMMLFASVDGISKVGSFDGQNSDLTVTFGFQPRFLMVKRIDAAGDWNVYDTVRGLVSGADQELRFNDNSAQSGHEVGDITSTGFTFACSASHDTCQSGAKFIYYAHA